MPNDINMFHELTALKKDHKALKVKATIGQIARNFEALEYKKVATSAPSRQTIVGAVIGY